MSSILLLRISPFLKVCENRVYHDFRFNKIEKLKTILHFYTKFEES